MALPELTDEERHAALNKAMQTRMARAEYKKLMKMGEATPEQALDASVVQHMHVDEWLRALPGIGPKRAAKIMDEVGIAPTRRVQGLGVRQRELLLEVLEHVC